MSDSSGYIDTVDIRNVYFTFAKVNPLFSCGRRVEDTLEALRQKKLKIEDLPMLTFLVDANHNYFSLNNRRLYVLKQLLEEGLLPNDGKVAVRVRAVPQTKRMGSKYTPEKCSLKGMLVTSGVTRAAKKQLHDSAVQAQQNEVEECAGGGGDVPAPTVAEDRETKLIFTTTTTTIEDPTTTTTTTEVKTVGGSSSGNSNHNNSKKGKKAAAANKKQQQQQRDDSPPARGGKSKQLSSLEDELLNLARER
eukprot:PhM_4_TR5575/c0_g1_i1/m.5872